MEKRFEDCAGIMSIISMPRAANEQLVQPLPYWVIDDIYAIGLHGWTAHSMFDEIRDSKSSPSVSLANQHIHEMDLLRARLHLSPSQQTMVIDVMKRMEYANFMEECNINDSGYIYRSAWKSMGAAIPLLLLLMKTGTDKTMTKKCLSYFYHFIAARQLSDDAVDWKADFANNRSTLVTHLLSEAMRKDRSKRTVAALHAIFTDSVSLTIAKRMIHHSRMAISFARKMRCFKDTTFLEALPQFYERVAIRVLRQHQTRKRFDALFWSR